MPSRDPSTPDHTRYTADYHDALTASAREAADRILPIVFEIVPTASVLDVGCGYGSWLAAARALGATDLCGIEGPWAAAWRDRGVLDGEFDLVLRDLETPLVLDRAFDLVICLEVAEHLTPGRGPGFVADLCAAGGAVLFGAAIPGQRGTNHVNERWLSDWAAEFALAGYCGLDVVRPQVWADRSIPVKYRQNIVLFVPEANARATRLPSPPATALDLVHPAMFDQVRNEIPAEVTLRAHLRMLLGIPRAARRAVAHRRRPADT